MEILARLAIANELAQIAQHRQEEEEQPPRYSIAVGDSEQPASTQDYWARNTLRVIKK